MLQRTSLVSTRYRLRHVKMELNPNEAKVEAFKENLRLACDLLSLPKPDAEGAERHLLTCEETKKCLRPHQLPDAKYLIEMYYHLARAIKLQGFHRWADVDRCLFEARRVFDSSDQYRNKSIAHPLKALVCFMHGRWFFYAGEEKFEDAERLLKEACDIFYALNRSEDSEALASALSYNALIFLHNQRYEEARQAIDRAKYAFHSKSLEKSRRGEDSDLDPRIGQSLYAQGLLHLAQGNLPLAQKDLQEALSSYEKVLPDTHPLIGAAKIALGETHYAQKKYKTAAVLVKRGIACLNNQEHLPYYLGLTKKAEEIVKILAVDEENKFVARSLTACPDQAQLEQVGTSICDRWEKVARKRAIGFLYREIDTIKKNHPFDIEIQSQAMLAKWQEKRGSEATIAELILALMESGNTKTAEDVFGSESVRGMKVLGKALDEKELNSIAKAIGNKWEELAVTEEIKFSMSEVAEIRTSASSNQCYRLMEKWASDPNKKTTALNMVMALKKIGKEGVAVDTFGRDAVQLVTIT